ncbi:MAG TPA: M56 family metallopeptidase, partial [Phycisphaerae bacterium]
QIACGFYWFNPMAWLAWRRMQIERERACDDLVLSTGAKASAYAQHLLDSAAAAPAFRFAGAALAMARPSTLEERLRTILDPHRNRRALSASGILAIVALVLAGVVPVASLQGQENGTSAPPLAAGGDGAAGTRPTGSPGRSAIRGAAFGRGPIASSGSANVSTGEGPTCSLDATIYDVRMPVDKIGQLDLDALTKAAATAGGFEKALAELGTSLPLYRANQSVRLSGDSITIGTQTPYITNTQVSNRGEAINSVSYTSTGAVFNIAGKNAAPGNVELDLSIELSTMSEGATAISNNVKAALFRRTTMSHKGQIVPRQPFVVVSVDAAAVDSNGKAVAYIARITLGVPQLAAPLTAP